MGNGAKETDWADYGAAEGKGEVKEYTGEEKILPEEGKLPSLETKESPGSVLSIEDDLPDDERIPDVISEDVPEEE